MIENELTFLVKRLPKDLKTSRNITQEDWSVNAYLAGKSFAQIKRFL